MDSKAQPAFIPYDKTLAAKARENRNNPTGPEKKMWYEILSENKTGYKFLRQKPLDRFIVDFYCAKLLLVIELDGESHDETEEYDKKRTLRLNQFGIKVVRYLNDDVLSHTEAVFDDVMREITIREKKFGLQPPKSPLSGGLEISAPTKIILLGEHAVVYGAPAISLPIDLPTTVHVVPKDHFAISSSEPLSGSDRKKLEDHIRIILKNLGKKEKPPIGLHIILKIPPGIGCGVSAGIAVALTKALYQFFEIPISQKKLFTVVEKLEQKNHGNPSGIDHTTIILNEPIVFQRSRHSDQRLAVRNSEEPSGSRKAVSGQWSELRHETVPEIRNQEILKNCYLVNTGKPEETTKEMVTYVAERYREFPHETRILFQKINVIVPIVRSALKRGDTEVFRDIMNEAGMILEELGVVSEKVKKISVKIRENGGMAKVSGAGGRKGSGSGILLVWHRQRDFVEHICKKYGFGYWSIPITNNQ